MTGPDLSAAPTRRHLDLDAKTQLVGALSATRVMTDEHSRRQILSEMVEQFGPAFNPDMSGNANSATLAFVTACIRLGAVHHLVAVLAMLCGDTDELARLRSLAHELLPLPDVERARRRRLESLLNSGPENAIAAVLTEPTVGPHLNSLFDGSLANGEAYRRLEEIPGRTGERARLIYLEHVAHQIDSDASLELHRIIDLMAGDLGGRRLVESHCRAMFDTTTSMDAQRPAEQPADPMVDNANPGDDVNSSSTATDQEVQPAGRPSIWGGMPPRNADFTGREDLLVAVHRQLNERERTALVSQPLHGLGGVGKSQLAVEYAYRYLQNYDLVWLIHADDDRSIRRGLVSLAKKLELPGLAVKNAVDGVLDALRRAAEPYRRWLLIFDNADNPASLRAYLPAGPGHVLVTSRNRDWAIEPNAVEVDVFTPQECAELLARRWPELSREQAAELAERLGRLPLALEQAASVHQQTGMQFEEYVHILETHPTAVLGEGAPPGYPDSVAVTLWLAYERLRERSLAAAQLLELCVFLSPNPIAVPMLMRGRGAPLPAPLDKVIRDDAGLRMAVRDLGRFALAQIDPGRDLIRVHTLIGAILRDKLAEEAKAANERIVHALLGLANPGSPDDWMNWRLHAQIAPHVVSSGVLYSADPDARQVVLDQIRYLLSIGDYAESRRLAEQAVETWRGSLGPDHETTLLASRHLANALRALGEYAGARAINKDVLDRMRATLTSDHEHTLATAMNVASDLRLVGDFERARELDEENYQRYCLVMGEDDLTTWRQAHNLAVDYRLLGAFRQAWELDNKTAYRLEEILGEDHSRTLYSFASLVRDLHGLGQYQEALALQRDKLRLHENRLPPHHNELMFAKRNLAILWRRTGNYPRALDQAQLNYEVCARAYGDVHEHTLASMITLCNTLRAVRDLDAARLLGDEALERYRGLLGQDHPFTLACAVNLAIVLRALNEDGPATELDELALTGLRSRLGDDHPYALCAANNKANDLARAGLAEAAMDLSEDTYHRSRRVRGEYHPLTLSCAMNLILDLQSCAEFVRAGQLRMTTFPRLRERFGHEHPEIVSARNDDRMECDIELPPT